MNIIRQLLNPYNPDQIRQMHAIYDMPFAEGPSLLELTQDEECSPEERQIYTDMANRRRNEPTIYSIRRRHTCFPGYQFKFNQPKGRFFENPYPYACAKVDFIRSRELDPAKIRQAYQLAKDGFRALYQIQTTSYDERQKIRQEISTFSQANPLEYYFVQRVVEPTYNSFRDGIDIFLRELSKEARAPINAMFVGEEPSDDAADVKEFGKDIVRYGRYTYNSMNYRIEHAYLRMVSQLDWALEKDLDQDRFKQHGFIHFDSERYRACKAYEKRTLLRRVYLLGFILLLSATAFKYFSKTWAARPSDIAQR